MFDKKRFKMALMEKEMSVKTLSEVTGMDSSTCYRKIKRGGDFTREEIHAIRIAMGLTSAEAESIFFAPHLAKTQEAS